MTVIRTPTIIVCTHSFTAQHSSDNRLYAVLPLCTVASHLPGLLAAQKRQSMH
jgi:hypothetical protein